MKEQNMKACLKESYFDVGVMRKTVNGYWRSVMGNFLEKGDSEEFEYEDSSEIVYVHMQE